MMVRSVAQEFASQVTTRSSLAALLTAPRFAIEHLDGPNIREIFERVAHYDSLLASWLTSISAENERAELRRALDAVEGQASEARASELLAVTVLEELREELVETQRRLQSLEEHARDLSGRERRQLILDSVKVIAQVAATVEGDGKALSHDDLTRKVRSLVERNGLEMHAVPGEMVRFDPLLHTAPGSRPDVGEEVNVARPGYTWVYGEERISILPALVHRVIDSQETE